MNDFYSFLRFALPGISSSTEFIIIISLSINWKKFILQISEIQKQDLPIALTITVFTLITIGIGFKYNLVYRTIPWMKVDYSIFAKHLKNQNLISIDFTNFALGQSDTDNITRDNSWGIVNTLWHSRTGESVLIKEATERSEKFAHLLHNSGTSLIGFITVSIFFCIIVFNFCEYFEGCKLLLVIIIVVIPLGIAHFLFFKRTLNDFRRFVEVILYKDLSNTAQKLENTKNKKKKNTN